MNDNDILENLAKAVQAALSKHDAAFILSFVQALSSGGNPDSSYDANGVTQVDDVGLVNFRPVDIHVEQLKRAANNGDTLAQYKLKAAARRGYLFEGRLKDVAPGSPAYWNITVNCGTARFQGSSSFTGIIMDQIKLFVPNDDPASAMRVKLGDVVHFSEIRAIPSNITDPDDAAMWIIARIEEHVPPPDWSGSPSK